MTCTPARTTIPKRPALNQIQSFARLLLSSALLLPLCLVFFLAVGCGGGGGGGKPVTDANTGVNIGPDAGQCGAPGQPCCGGNSCNGSGCCLAVTAGAQTTRQCVGSGQSCSAGGVAGTCAVGSCSLPGGTSCGALAQPCCGATDAGGGAAVTFCTANGARCVVGTCSACGGPGQACCQGTNANQCQGALLCLAVAGGGNICNACGGTGQPCCPNNTCNSGLGCSNPPGNNTPATCDTCGASGQACCPGNNCQTGLACAGLAGGGAGSCASCGASGQICCAGANRCQSGLNCISGATDDVCGVCGGPGQPCCGTGNAGTCSPGLACTDRNNATGLPGMCATCGGTGQPCCPVNGGADGGTQPACGTTMSCLVSTTGNQCGACGGAGQPCCGTGNAGTCSTGFACSGRNAGAGAPGMCAPCGAAGQLCCPMAGGAMACQAALSCIVSATGNQCGACGGLGQACCGTGNGGTCTTAGTACGGRNAGAGAPGMCATCGGTGQLCCPAGGAPVDGGPPPTACQGALACLLAPMDNHCGSCGAAGQPCCGTGNNPTCATGLACGGRVLATGVPGMCAACGGAGQLCCPTNLAPVDGGPAPTACTATLACIIATAGNQCGACGAAGQSCCGVGNNGTCTAGLGLTCVGRMNAGGVPGTCTAPVTPVDAGAPDVPAGQ